MAAGWDFRELDALPDDEWDLGPPPPQEPEHVEALQSNNEPWPTWPAAPEANAATERAVPYSSSPLNFSTPPRHVNAQANRNRIPSPTRLATGFAAYDTVSFPYTAASTSTSTRAPDTQPAQQNRRPQGESSQNNTRGPVFGTTATRDPFAELLQQREARRREAPVQPWDITDSGSDNEVVDDSYQIQSTASDSEQDMPPRRRQPRQAANSSGVVDLTQSPTSTPQESTRTRKRGAESGSGSEPSKRRKGAAPKPTEVLDVEEEDQAPSADAELVSAQQMDALKQQESGRDDGPVKMGKRTCIICLENFTNATVAHCGHIFCHECLTRALMASEKHSDRRTGNCPACRKPISRMKGITIIPINFMKASAFNTKGRGRELSA